jgi:hypothetical protein
MPFFLPTKPYRITRWLMFHIYNKILIYRKINLNNN